MKKKASVIAFAINKGGVGKTTSSLAVSQVLAICGYKVLFLDLDAQRNATRHLGAELDIRNVSFTDLLIDGIEKEDIMGMVRETNFKGISIIPATGELYDIEMKLIKTILQFSEKDVLVCLRDNLEHIKDEFDYIIIDSSPSLGYLNKCIVAATDKVISPIESDSYSLDALNSQSDFIQSVNMICETNTVFEGAFLNRITQNTNLTKAYREGLKESFGNDKFYIDSPIRTCNKVKEAAAELEPLFSYAPKCTTAIDYIRLTITMGLIDKKHFQTLEEKYKGNI